MIYVVTALYQEAHGFIRELELKKNTAYAPFEVFDNESAGIRLVVTGVGEIAAAAADTGRQTPPRSETCTCVTRSRSRRPEKRSIRIFCTGTRGGNANL